MFSVNLDKLDNKIVISYKNYVDLQQIEQVYLRLQDAVHGLKKGFTVLIDLSLLERMDIDTMPAIEKIMDLFNKNGVSKVVRIIPDKKKDIGFNIMGAFHYSKGVAVHTYKSYEEALRKVIEKQTTVR